VRQRIWRLRNYVIIKDAEHYAIKDRSIVTNINRIIRAMISIEVVAQNVGMMRDGDDTEQRFLKNIHYVLNV
jgi:hypothetical protein